MAATAPAAPTTTDRMRQVTVTAAAVFCVVGTLFGVGVLGTRVEESSGGALAADATRLAPMGPAFTIWSVVYLGLVAFTVWQWLPSRAADRRLRRIGALAAASMALNAVWLLVTQQGWIWLSVAVIAVLVLVLGRLVAGLDREQGPVAAADRLVVDGTFGLYLGWVMVATCANVAAAAASGGLDLPGAVADAAAVAVLAVVVGLVAWVQRRTGPRWTITAAACWGLGWIAAGRVLDAPQSPVVALAAVLAALGAVAVTARVGSGRGRGAAAGRIQAASPGPSSRAR